MQVKPHFIKSLIAGLFASSAGVFMALPGVAQEAPTLSGLLETLPPESRIDPTATESIPAPVAGESAEEIPVVEEPMEDESIEAVEPMEDDAIEAVEPLEDEAIEAVEPLEDEAIEAGEPLEDESVEAVEPLEDESVEAVEPLEDESVEAVEPLEDESVEAGEPMEDESVEAAEPEVDTADFTIAELTSNSDSFDTLAAALAAADLTEILGSEGPYTVFAPTDEAFAALPAGSVDQLLLPENKDLLVQILSYHVVPGTVLAGDLETGNVTTVEGSDLAVAVDENVTVNNANVLLADIEASNGVIHVIDQVMLPPTPEANADMDTAAPVQ